jgi:hypothetical protein
MIIASPVKTVQAPVAERYHGLSQRYHGLSPGKTESTMHKFLDTQPGVFDPDTIQILTAAFDDAWAAVQASGSPLAMNSYAVDARTILAQHIIKLGKEGERDRRQLCDNALAHLAKIKLRTIPPKR